MSSPAYAITPAGFPTPKPTGFTVTNGTAAKVVVEPQAAAIATATAPAFYGGCTLLDLIASSTDAAAKDVLLWLGKVLTTQDAAETGNITLSAQNKLSRTANSWLTDGWLVGDAVMVFAAPGTAQVVAAVDGIAGVITALTSTDLTVNGTPWAAGSNVLTAGSRIVNVSQLFRATVEANSGNSNSIPNVSLLANTMDSAQIRTELKLGADAMLIAGMQAAVAALPAQVMLSPRIARY